MTTETVEKIEVDVNLDKPVACQAIDSVSGHLLECPVPATWIRIYACCGATRTYCDPHRDECFAIGEREQHRGMVCNMCRTETYIPGEGTWRRL